MKNEIIQIQELAEELLRSIIRNLEKWKVHLSFIDNIWDANLTDTQLISKFNEKNFFFHGVLLIFMVAWVVPLKDKKGITITNGFLKSLRWVCSQSKQNMGV